MAQQAQIAASGPIDLKAAIRVARDFVTTVIDDEPLTNLLFEEVEVAENGDWLITFGYDRHLAENPLSRLGIEGSIAERIYRQVRVDRASGKPLALKIRSL